MPERWEAGSVFPVWLPESRVDFLVCACAKVGRTGGWEEVIGWASQTAHTFTFGSCRVA